MRFGEPQRTHRADARRRRDPHRREEARDRARRAGGGAGAPPLKVTRGTLFKYIKNVRPASEGCVTDE